MGIQRINMPIVIVPGLGGSDDNHWQSHWERSFSAQRVHQEDWNRPSLGRWMGSLLQSVMQTPDCIVVAHSLGCPLLIHALKRFPGLPLKGVLLVAPADVDASAAMPAHVSDFSNLPEIALPCASRTVVSSNDPYISLERAALLSSVWGSTLVNVGARGHINVASGFGPWPQGEQILQELANEALKSRGPKPVQNSQERRNYGRKNS